MTIIHWAWNASLDPAVTGYIIRAGQQSGAYTLANNVGNVLDGTLDYPSDGRWYTAIGAYTPTGELLGPETLSLLTPGRVINPYVPNRFVSRR